MVGSMEISLELRFYLKNDASIHVIRSLKPDNEAKGLTIHSYCEEGIVIYKISGEASSVRAAANDVFRCIKPLITLLCDTD